MNGKILPAISVFLVLACICPPASAEDVQMLTMSGTRLSTEEAESLEKRITNDPNDVISRTKLLGYYLLKAHQDASAREAKQKHILWLIENEPEAEVLGFPEGQLHPMTDPEAYPKGKRIWLEQIESKPKNLAVLHNSAQFFLLHDRNLAEQLLLKGKSLDPQNPKWPNSLGLLYTLGLMRIPEAKRKDMARKALGQFEEAYDISEDVMRDYLLQQLTKAAMEAGELDKAGKYAERMLSQSSQNWNYGNNVHHGNIILGRIALRSGDVEKAKQHLIEAGKTPGSPQLNPFGPNMTLAKELLEIGEKESVVQYFKLCSNFWEMGKDHLDMWSAAVKAGKTPKFGANVSY